MQGTMTGYDASPSTWTSRLSFVEGGQRCESPHLVTILSNVYKVLRHPHCTVRQGMKDSREWLVFGRTNLVQDRYRRFVLILLEACVDEVAQMDSKFLLRRLTGHVFWRCNGHELYGLCYLLPSAGSVRRQKGCMQSDSKVKMQTRNPEGR